MIICLGCAVLSGLRLPPHIVSLGIVITFMFSSSKDKLFIRLKITRGTHIIEGTFNKYISKLI